MTTKDLAEGFALRLAQRLREMGYVHPRSGKIDVFRFAHEKRYKHSSYFYIWLGGRKDRERPSIPRWPELCRLAEDLGVTPVWLLFGDPSWKAEDG